WTTPRTRTEQAVRDTGSAVHRAAAALPADLDHPSVLHQHGHDPLARRERAHALAGGRIGLGVILVGLGAAELQPLPETACVGTRRGAEELNPGHDAVPPGPRA